MNFEQEGEIDGDASEGVMFLTGQDTNSAHPPTITEIGHGGKFTASGDVQYFPGNNFICHIDAKSEVHRALLNFSLAMQKGPTADHFAFLPSASFHMTVFPAICGNPLGHDGWPVDIAPQSSLDEIHKIYRSKLCGQTFEKHFNVAPIGSDFGTNIILEPSTNSDKEKLWQARRQLQALTGLYRSDFTEYRFHISICYRTRWMNVSTAKTHLAFTKPLLDEFFSRVSEINLGQIEFCRFSNMNHFEIDTLI